MYNKDKLSLFISNYKIFLLSSKGKGIDERVGMLNCFKSNWTASSFDYSLMLKSSLYESMNFLEPAINNFFENLIYISKIKSKSIKLLLNSLYDERLDLGDRLEGFYESFFELMENSYNKYDLDTNIDEIISLLLWLRFPEKYLPYSYSLANTFAEIIESDLLFKNEFLKSNLINWYKLGVILSSSLANEDLLSKNISCQFTSSLSYELVNKLLVLNFLDNIDLI